MHAIDRLIAAAEVISLTPHIENYLQWHDPKALEQLRNAIINARAARELES
jgi:hypothetical protein